MDFGADFKTKLKAVSAITDIVGSSTSARIYPDVPKHSMTVPAIVYIENSGGTSDESLAGPIGMGQTVMLVDSYAATRSAANSLAETIRVAIQGPINTTWGDSHVSSVHVLGSRVTDVKWTDDKQSIKWWITRRIYRIFHEEATS